MSRSYRNARVVVLDTAGAHYGSGDHQPLPNGFDLTDLPRVLAGARATIGIGGEGVVCIDGVTLDQLAGRAVPGWSYTELRPWTTYIRTEDGGAETIVHVGILPAARDHKPGPLVPAAHSSRDLAMLLDRYHHLTGSPWHTTSGVSGVGALRSRYTSPVRGAQPLWRFKLPAGYERVRGLGNMYWNTHELPAGATGYLMYVDVHAAYVGGMRNAAVAWGELRETGTIAFDWKKPGYWQINAHRIPDELLDDWHRPPVIPPRLIRNGAVWVTTPVARYLQREGGVDIEVLDSLTSDNGQAVARSYAERLNSVRMGMLGEVPEPVSVAVKQTYAQMVGMCAKQGGRIHRVDWVHHWQDQTRMNMLRRFDRAHELLGLWPVRVVSDAAYYLWPTRNVSELLSALGAGHGAGLFHWVPEKSLTVQEYREKFGAKQRVQERV